MRKSFLNIALIAFALTFLFSGCKYEDGPFMSLRHKGNRLAHIWKFTNVTFDGNDITDQYNRDSVMISFEIYRMGAFAFNLRDKDGNIFDRTGRNSVYEDYSKDISESKPPFINLKGGKWTFIENLNSLQMKYELSYNDESEIPIYEIKELRNKKLKLSGKDIDSGKDIVLEFEQLELNK